MWKARPGDTEKGKAMSGNECSQRAEPILQHHVPRTRLSHCLLLLTLSNSASASPSFIHLCLQICSMESLLLGSSTSMWRIRCSHSAREERLGHPWGGTRLLQRSLPKLPSRKSPHRNTASLLHFTPAGSPACHTAADIDSPVLRSSKATLATQSPVTLSLPILM